MFVHCRQGARRVLILACIGIATPAAAQITFIGHADFTWEVSLDHGTTWRAGVIQTETTHGTVLARARLTWDEPQAQWYSSMAFDGIWSSDLPGTIGDTILSYSKGDLVSYNQELLAPMSIGNLIKFDSPLDAEPPGLGPSWYYAVVTSAFGLNGGALTLLSYEVLLDGSAGRRALDQAVYVNPAHPEYNIFFRRVDPITGLTSYNFPTVAYHPAVLDVVPAPNSCAFALALGALAIQRRRR